MAIYATESWHHSLVPSCQWPMEGFVAARKILVFLFLLILSEPQPCVMTSGTFLALLH